MSFPIISADSHVAIGDDAVLAKLPKKHHDSFREARMKYIQRLMARDAETIEQAEEKISEAIPLAKEQFDFENEFPDWSIETAGPLSGTGGSTDVESRTVIIYANRNRELDEFVTTILHEWGHAIDAERLTDEERAQYLLIRGIDPETPWRSQEAHSIEEWGLQPSEDFAEVMVALWSDGETVPRTSQIAPAPDSDTLAAVALLVER